MSYQPDFEMAYRIADKDNARLRALNTELLAATEALVERYSGGASLSKALPEWARLRAAIAKAKGGK